MTRTLISLVLGILLITATISIIAAKSVPEDEVALRAVSTGLGQFSTDFYNTSSKQKQDNLICSPVSAGIVLAMTSFGARGNTEKQMRETLRMPDGVLSKKGYQILIDALNSVNKVTLKLAQKIYTDNNFQVEPDFKELTENYFRSTSESIDFGKPEKASETINAWCEERTNKRIKDVVTPDDLRGALIVLINAVYFKGNWLSKFRGSETSPRPFHVDAQTTKDVDTMYQEKSFNYGALPELDAVYVELPYEHENEDDSISMFIILPNQVGGLQKSTDNLDKVNFQELHNNRQSTLLHLFMPKFKIESTLNLQSVLESMGMQDMFQNNADFSGIAKAPALRISKVVQKAFIEVNEEGSEAAAVTVVIGLERSGLSLRPQPIVLKIDRPFYYAIVHTSTNTVLFQVVGPVPTSLIIYKRRPITMAINRPFNYVIVHISTNTVLFQAIIAVPMSAIIYDPPPVILEINRPFIYAIHHSKTNTILFQGHVHLPSMN